MLALVLLLPACSEPNADFIGQWKIDKKDLKQSIEDEHPGTDESISKLRSRFVEANEDAAWVFNEDRTYVQEGAFPSRGQYEIYDYGNDWVLIRLFADPLTDEHHNLYGDADEIKSANKMDLNQLIEYHGITNGNAPSLIGIKIINADQFREFGLIVENGRLTDKREEGALFNRLD